MTQSLQQVRRDKVREVFDSVLGGEKVRLYPLSIAVSEAYDQGSTTTDFSFKERRQETEIVSIKQSKGKGFIDSIFNGLHRHYSSSYPSLEKITLTNLSVSPIRPRQKKELGSDAKAMVTFAVEVSKYGTAEFDFESRSLIYSGLSAALAAFQFYINCEKTFNKLIDTVEDAKKRNRGDILQRCLYDLSRITEVNTYDRASKN